MFNERNTKAADETVSQSVGKNSVPALPFRGRVAAVTGSVLHATEAFAHKAVGETRSQKANVVAAL